MIGTILQNRYRLEAELGQGGMGTVFRGYDILLDRPVAIKLLSGQSLSAEGHSRLLHEAQSTAHLNHPNITSVYDAGEAEGVPYIVMELLEGRSLYGYRPESLDEVYSLARQISSALDHAHSHQVIHRDLKPENVFITSQGVVKLMDFGLARAKTASRLSLEGAIVGTVFYLAPEQATGRAIDHRVDLYAFGVILYELVTGELPFTGDDPLAVISQHIHTPVIPPSAHRPDLPADLESIILKLLAKDPAERFSSAHEVSLALSGLGDSAESRQASKKIPNNLPEQVSTFIGRQDEIEEVQRRLSASRLVTLTGAGGSGKTRLALQVASALLDRFPGGVWLVELAPLSDPNLLPQTVLSALGIPEQAGRQPLETLTDYLRSRRLLLVLDNCEHIIDACARFIISLLQACSQLKILATSREALGITGENAWIVPSLSIPDPRQFGQIEPPSQARMGDGPPERERQSSQEQGLPASAVASLASYESVQLFVDRAQAVQPTFSLTGQNALAVAQVCYRLDGIPLAIELAAARMKALTVEQIAARLDDRFNLLTLGSRTALPRQQTLKATIDWSYDLLSSQERLLLNRLSVFPDDWNLESAEAICADDELARLQVLDLLTRLVDKSLVSVEEQGSEARYRMLETIRQYGREKLQSSGEAEMIGLHHREFFRRMAAEAEPALRTSSQVAWLDRLEIEHDNFRAALDWSYERSDYLQALELAGNLARFWYLRGYWSEGREWLQRLLAADSTPVSDLQNPERRLAAAVRAKALSGAGWLADDRGPEEAFYQESLAIYRALGETWGTAFSLRGLGVSASNQGQYDRAGEYLNESLALFKEAGDPWGSALVFFNLGWLAINQGDEKRAKEAWDQGQPLFQQSGDRWGLAVILDAYGYYYRQQNDYKSAAKVSKQSLALFRELGDKAGITTSLSRLGSVAFRRDDFPQTISLYEESLAISEEMGYKWDAAFSIRVLGLVACYQGDYERSRALLDESLNRYREIESQWGIGTTLGTRALLTHYQGEAGAAEMWQKSLRILQEQDDPSGVAFAQYGLGRIAYYEGDYSQAAEYLEASLAGYLQAGDNYNLASTRNFLGRVRLAEGQVDQARDLFVQSLGQFRVLGSKRGVVESLEGLAGVAVAREQAERAAILFGMAESIRDSIHAPVPLVERQEYASIVAAARSILGEDAFNNAWKEGCDLALNDWKQAMRYAGEDVST